MITDICLRVKHFSKLKRYAKAKGLEIETYGETRTLVKSLVVKDRIATHRSRVRVRPKTDYATVRNITIEQVREVRALRIGRVLLGYPMRMSELYPDPKRVPRPEPEKPTCPICRTADNVHWIQRNHWTCTANHFPQHFGMLRLT